MAAKPDDWKRLPFGETAPIPYQASFNDAEYQKITQGLLPQAMEDKWFAYFDNSSLYFHRSWTGQAVYLVAFKFSGGCYIVTEAVCAVEILERSDAAYQSELLDFLIQNFLLGHVRPFPLPAGLNEQVPGIYQHAISGTEYRETAVARKPWWKFWQ
ncbi:hypothetical protein [Sphingomonas colocasiae]|uniref:DUF1851 domain-containing protein n=1 Tax=Sphingomonas colocasiae TaxID=1848973 RepID=A0ABS7PLS6_9SPHN|nr:hypothetical protein [Sphingomonas colocasiae]MBY8822231.1 hypothetical protein [Sphingomonas colocasiae]